MSSVNTRIRNLRPSETLAVKARATELRAQGKTIFDLSAGEPDIDTPEYIKEAARQAMAAGKTKYTAVAGIPELREALAAKLTNENKIPTEAASVIVTNGGKQAIGEFFEVFLEPGDEVIVAAPYWVSYPPMIELAQGKPVIVKTTPVSGYRLTPSQLKAAITPKTRAVIFNSPSNPTGATYTAAEMAALGEVLAPTRAWVISDEVYERLVYGGFSFTSFAAAVPAMKDRVVTVNAFSKTYSMTGWRVGYATGPKDIIGAMINYQSQTTSNVCSIAQYAALGALKGNHDFLPPLVASYDRRINLALDIIEKTPGLRVDHRPEGAFFLFVRIEELLGHRKGELAGSGAVASMFIEKAGVAVVAGDPFGDDNAFRISISSADENIREGLTRIQKVVGDYMGAK